MPPTRSESAMLAPANPAADAMTQPANTDTPAGEADWLCGVIDGHVDSLRAASLGKAFRLEGAPFRLFATGRNTIYRISGRFDWFLRLSRAGDRRFLDREQRGAEAVG